VQIKISNATEQIIGISVSKPEKGTRRFRRANSFNAFTLALFLPKLAKINGVHHRLVACIIGMETITAVIARIENERVERIGNGLREIEDSVECIAAPKKGVDDL
jgi:hypothetical protein